MDSENEGADVENNLEQEVEEDEQAQEKNSRSKLFLKLPQFGSKKKNEQ